MTDNRPVFCIITASGCPACVNFKKSQYNDLMKLLNSKPLLGRIRVVEIENPNTASDLPSKSIDGKYVIPRDLKRFIGWFPSFLLINGTSWNNGVNLGGSVFNGIWNSNGIIVPDDSVSKNSSGEIKRNARMMNSENIKLWIEEQLSKNNDVMNGPLKIEDYQNNNDSKNENYNTNKVCSNRFRLL